MDNQELLEQLIEAVHTKRNIYRMKKNPEESSKGFVLRYLNNHEAGEVNPTELCKAMNVTTPRITNILNEMERDGLIERQISKTDRRRISVVLTEAGKKDIVIRKNRQLEYFNRLADALGEEDTRAYIRILKVETEIATNKE